MQQLHHVSSGKEQHKENHVWLHRKYTLYTYITSHLKLLSFFLACPEKCPVTRHILMTWTLLLFHIIELPRMAQCFNSLGNYLKTCGVTKINVSHKWLGTSLSLSLSLCLSLFLSLSLSLSLFLFFSLSNWVSVMMVSVSGLSSSIFASVIPTRPWREGFPCSAVPVSQWNIPS